jgi:hypothetical protein
MNGIEPGRRSCTFKIYYFRNAAGKFRPARKCSVYLVLRSMRYSIETVKSYFIHLDNKKVFAFIITVLTALLFFPFPDSVTTATTVGIDDPLAFVFTYLLRGHVQMGKDIIFPHGPLAFIMYPLPGDSLWWIATGFVLLMRLTRSYSLMKLVIDKSWNYILFATVGLIVLSIYGGVLMTLIEAVVLLLLNYHKNRHQSWMIAAFLLSAIAFYIKAYAGILCLSILVPFIMLLTIEVLLKKEKPWRLVYALLFPSGIVVTWLSLYGTLHGLPRFIKGMQQLASDNSAAAALYPDNLWVLLCLGLLIGGLLVSINLRDVKSRYYFALILPALFASWKYGMAREDFYHHFSLIIFLFFVIIVFFIYTGRQKWMNILPAFVAFALFFSNFLYVNRYEKRDYPSIGGFLKVIHVATDYRNFSDTCQQRSDRNVEVNKVSPEIRSMIGGKTVDIYPWNYYYIAANNFKWQPRPVIHSYAAYTQWLDDLNAKHMSSKDAPEFVIWEMQADSRDASGGNMEGVDGRYVLNDEPHTMLSMIANYRFVTRQPGPHPALVLVKRERPLVFEAKDVSKAETTWNSWFNVPCSSNGLLLASVEMKSNLQGRLKGMLYKDDDVYVYYMFSNGDIIKYRVVPRTMAYGLWIDPLIMNPELKLKEAKVVKMCFRCRNENMMQSKIQVTFRQVLPTDNSWTGKDKNSFVYDFFGIDTNKMRTTFYSQTFGRVSEPQSFVSPVSGPDVQNAEGLKQVVNPDAFSPTISLNLDSLQRANPFTDGLMMSQVWMKAPENAKVSLVISVEEENKTIIWKSVDLKNSLLNKNEYNLVTNFLDLDDSIKSINGAMLKAYLWNTGKEAVYWKNFSTRVSGCPVKK